MPYYKAIVFCSNAIDGYFRYKDIFQIYPLDDQPAPKTKVSKGRPMILEYFVDEANLAEIKVPTDFVEATDMIREMAASSNFQKRLLNLLTAFSNYHFYSPRLEVQWFIDVDKDLGEDALNNQTSREGLNLFYYPGLNKVSKITSLTDVAFPQIPAVKHPNCFMSLNLDGSEKVQFSEHIFSAFHNYLLLDEDDIRTVDSAISLISQGVDLFEKNKSLSFISLVSSVETMVSHDTRNVKNETCETCGQTRYKVMSKFRDYIFKYVVNNERAKSEINRIYGLRSKIVHTGLLMLADTNFDWSESEDQDSQFQTHIQAMQIARVSLINWILFRWQEAVKKNENVA